jgi:AI-2E family transporter
VLKISGVPFAGLISLFVAIADLIPVVGATLGAVVAAIAAFVHSTTAGIAVVVFFLVCQQLENHLLQPLIFSLTVKLNPLAVLIAILLGVELAGILGALLADPGRRHRPGQPTRPLGPPRGATKTTAHGGSGPGAGGPSADRGRSRASQTLIALPHTGGGLTDTRAVRRDVAPGHTR